MEEKEQQLQLFKIRDLRKKDQFKIDDAYLNGYARVCGENATLVYMSLCRHAEFNTQKAFPSQEKIAWEHGISRRSVIRGLKKLIEYNIVIVEKEYKKGKFSNNIYILLDKSEWKDYRVTISHKEEPCDKNRVTPTAYGQSHTKDNKEQRITNIKDNKEVYASQGDADSTGKIINELIEKFKPVNPSYERLFANKTQRACLERLLKKMGREKLEKILDILPKIFGKPYSPTITTPYQLENRIADLFAFLKKEQQKGPKLIEI